MKLLRNPFLVLIFLLFSVVWRPASVFAARWTEIYNPRFWGQGSIGVYSAPANLVLAVTNGGAYTNAGTTNTFTYRIYGTNSQGRTPISSTTNITFAESTNASAVAIGWDRLDGISGYILEKSYDGGTNWTNHFHYAASATNATDWQYSSFSEGSNTATEISSSVPFLTNEPTFAAWLTNNTYVKSNSGNWAGTWQGLGTSAFASAAQGALADSSVQTNGTNYLNLFGATNALNIRVNTDLAAATNNLFGSTNVLNIRVNTDIATATNNLYGATNALNVRVNTDLATATNNLYGATNALNADVLELKGKTGTYNQAATDASAGTNFISTNTLQAQITNHAANGVANVLHFTATEKAIATNPPSTNGFAPTNWVIDNFALESDFTNHVADGEADVNHMTDAEKAIATNPASGIAGWSGVPATGQVQYLEYKMLTNLTLTSTNASPDISGVYTQIADVGGKSSWGNATKGFYVWFNVNQHIIGTNGSGSPSGVYWGLGESQPIGSYIVVGDCTGTIAVAYSYTYSTAVTTAVWKAGYNNVNRAWQLERDGTVLESRYAESNVLAKTPFGNGAGWTNLSVPATNTLVGATQTLNTAVGVLNTGKVDRVDTNGWTVTTHSGLATGTPVYVESDPVHTNWLATNTYVKTESDPVFTNFAATNTYVKVESDPVHTNWLATNTYVKTESDPVFTNWVSTNTYVKAESDPVFTNWAATNTYLQSLPLTNDLIGATNSMNVDLSIIKTNYASLPLYTTIRTQLFAGADSTGRVTSAAGDAGKFLKADGTWATPAGAGDFKADGSVAMTGDLDFGGQRGTNATQISAGTGTFANVLTLDGNTVLTNIVLAFTNDIISSTNALNTATNGLQIQVNGLKDSTNALNTATNALNANKLNASFTNTGILTALQVTGGATTNSVFVCTNNDGQMGFMVLPKIIAYASVAKNYPSDANTVCPFNTITYQANGTWDGTNWTPGVIGCISINAGMRLTMSGSLSGSFQILVYKNDALNKMTEDEWTSAPVWYQNISYNDFCENTTNKYSIYVWHNSAKGATNYTSSWSTWFYGSVKP